MYVHARALDAFGGRTEEGGKRDMEGSEERVCAHDRETAREKK